MWTSSSSTDLPPWSRGSTLAGSTSRGSRSSKALTKLASAHKNHRVSELVKEQMLRRTTLLLSWSSDLVLACAEVDGTSVRELFMKVVARLAVVARVEDFAEVIEVQV